MARRIDFQIVDLPSRQLAHIQYQGPYAGNSALFETLFGTVYQWITDNDMESPDMESITVYHDDPEKVREADQRISVGYTVPPGTDGSGNIHMLELPSGKYAIGSFEVLPHEYGEAWKEILFYLRNIGLIPAGSLMYESYRNVPDEHPEKKQLVDICIGL